MIKPFGFLGFLMALVFFSGCARPAPQVIEPTQPASRDSYILLADKLAGEAQFKSSNYYLGLALGLFKKTDAWKEMIDCHMKMGDNHQELGNHDEAMGHFDQALRLAMEKSGVEYSELAHRFQKMAYKHFGQGAHDRAIDMYQKALSLLLRVFPEHHARVARIYNSLALVYWNKGDTAKATEYYNRSLSIKLRSFSRTQVDYTKKYTFIDGDHPDPAAFHDIGDYIRRSLKIHLETYGNIHPLIALLYDNIGIIYCLEGQYAHAMDFFRKSLNIRIELLGDESLECAESHKNIGICYRLQGDLLEALQFLQSSLQLKKAYYPENHPFLSDTYYQIGKVHFLQENFDQSLEYYQWSLLCLAPGFSQADIASNPEIGTPPLRGEMLRVLSDKATALRMRHLFGNAGPEDLIIALDTYQFISKLIDVVRRDLKSDDYKLLFGERSHQVYADAIRTASDLFEITGEESYKHKAFFFAEKSKAALLYEAVVESRAKQFSGIPAYLLEKESRLREEIAHYGTYLEREYQADSEGERILLAELEGEYYSKRAQYQNLIEGFERDYPEYFNLKHRLESVGVKTVQQSLPGKTGLVEYFVGEDNITIFVITATRFHVSSQPIGQEFSRITKQYYHSIKKIEDKSFLYLSQWLHKILIQPVLPWIDDLDHLIFIPHGDLHFIPFETLVGERNRGRDFYEFEYLIRRYTCSYHYSASLWFYKQKEKHIPRENKSFVGFAPVFFEPAPTGKSTHARHLPELLASEEEVKNIISLFEEKNEKALGYFYQAASEENFKTVGIGEFDYIHVATHSVSDQSNPKLSGLLFAPQEKTGDGNEDGILYSEETFNLDLNAELIVLSSCESGIGKLVKGEGMIALNRGFFYSGALNVIFSLWKVEDRATARLMVALYRNILNGRRIPSALRRAKLLLIQDRLTAFPRYWSGFILVGM
jgi:CHAT domain-containing protein/Tfp pilus assembly protein PilF